MRTSDTTGDHVATLRLVGVGRVVHAFGVEVDMNPSKVPGRGVGSSVHQIAAERSEEHTSELQSLMRISYAVFCLRTKWRRQSQKFRCRLCKAARNQR